MPPKCFYVQILHVNRKALLPDRSRRDPAIEFPTGDANGVEAHPVVLATIAMFFGLHMVSPARTVVPSSTTTLDRTKVALAPNTFSLKTACSQPSVHEHASHWKKRTLAAFVIRSNVQPTAVPGIDSHVGEAPQVPLEPLVSFTSLSGGTPSRSAKPSTALPAAAARSAPPSFAGEAASSFEHDDHVAPDSSAVTEATM